MKSWFYILYLHAVTSHCLADPLLKRTGTEEALVSLRSARSFSFLEFKDDVLAQLSKIAALTPQRQFYPNHLQTMQSTHWDPLLQPLSQHNAFATLVSHIFMHVKTLQVFHGCTFTNELPPSTQSLTIRAASRCASFYDRDLFEVMKTQCLDVPLNTDNIRREKRDSFMASYRIARSSMADLVTLSYFPHSMWDMITLWSESRIISAHAPEWSQPIQTLSYNRENWLAKDSSLESRWLEIHNLCRTLEPNEAASWRYQVAFSFSSMVYANPSTEKTALLYLALIANSGIRMIKHPSPTTSGGVYTLRDKFEPQRDVLRSRLQSDKRILALTPSHRLVKRASESRSEFRKRQRQDWNDRTTVALDNVVDHFLRQWPEINLQQLGGNVGDWINVTSSIRIANDYFSSCTANVQLRKYIKSIEKVLSSGHPTPTLPENNGTSFAESLCQRTTVHFMETFSQPSSPPRLCHLFTSPPPSELSPTAHRLSSPIPRVVKSSPATHRSDSRPQTTTQLETMLTRLEARHVGRASAICNLYVHDLRESCKVLEEDDWEQTGEVKLKSLLRYEELSAIECKSLLFKIRDTTDPSSIHGRVLSKAGLWPEVCSKTLLQQLNSHTRSASHATGWHELLVSFARAILEHQRSRRLLDHWVYARTDEFVNEMRNDCFDREETSHEPDWLLIQVCFSKLFCRLQTLSKLLD